MQQEKLLYAANEDLVRFLIRVFSLYTRHEAGWNAIIQPRTSRLDYSIPASLASSPELEARDRVLDFETF
ncbi:unnamed protein product [Larinioides sclopetarius]|uniref:Uncharacterized protein n=1 Tax=Larinioides sclopetarius TaxID=280406 RepID=A0AAV1Z125_9ARAC